MGEFMTRARLIFADANLRRRIGITLAILALFRIISAVPLPGVDALRLQASLAGDTLLGFLNIFSGGGLNTVSIFMLGVGPYITSSIIMQLASFVFPQLKEKYQENGEAGRRQFAQHSRYLSVPLAVVQAVALLALLGSQGILVELSFFDQMMNVIVATAGSVFLMWMGEQISEYGVGNGVSLIIFAGIVASIPTVFSQLFLTFNVSQLPLYLGFLIIAALIIAGIVYVSEAERPIPITYAKQVRGLKAAGGVQTYLPIRVNQSGVMPIIFGISVLVFPQILAGFLSQINHEVTLKIAEFLVFLTSNTIVYGIAYFVLVFGFTYLYTAINFDPEKIAENLQKSGAFVSGIRPGRPTAEYLSDVTSRLTLAGALFLGVIAILPLLMQAITGNPTLAIGGTGLLIVVSVVLELVKQLDAQATMREY